MQYFVAQIAASMWYSFKKVSVLVIGQFHFEKVSGMTIDVFPDVEQSWV